MLRTFDEWSRMGYKIKKGAKAVGKTPNGYLFSESQVVYSPRSGYRGMTYAHNSRDPFQDDWENDMYFDGDPWGLNS